MDKSELALVVVNEYLVVLGLDTIKELKDLPKIEKSLFENIKLKDIVSKYIEQLKTLYGQNEIKYYDRNRMKHYEYTLFKKLYELNNLSIILKRHVKYIDKDTYKKSTYLSCIK
jgi:hypothetical protein